MSLNPITYQSPLPSAGTDSEPSQQLGEEEFLSLLMAQMKNQDPMSPMESDQFMDQITSMNTVKQLMDANDRLAQLNLGMTSLNNEIAVNLVGKDVVARGDSFEHESGESHDLIFELQDPAAEVIVMVTNEAGDVVESFELGEQTAGSQTTSWSGRNSSGSEAPPGNYSYSVTAVDETGEAVAVTTFVSGTVDELRFVGGLPTLVIDGQEVGLDAILRVRTARSQDEAPAEEPAPESSTEASDKPAEQPGGNLYETGVNA